MKVLRIIMLLVIVVNCYDPRMTKKQCKEEFIEWIKMNMLVRAMRKNELIKKGKIEEINDEFSETKNDTLIIGLLFYLPCIGNTVNCGTPAQFIERMDVCIEEIK